MREQTGASPFHEPRVADELRVDAGHDPKERRLARPVRSEHADLRVRIEGERDAAQHLALRRHDLLELIHGEDVLAGHVNTVAVEAVGSSDHSGEGRVTDRWARSPVTWSRRPPAG